MAKKDPNLRSVETERTDRYVLGEVRKGAAAVASFLICLKCGFRTQKPEDVLYKYCNRCQRWLDKPDHGGTIR